MTACFFVPHTHKAGAALAATAKKPPRAGRAKRPEVTGPSPAARAGGAITASALASGDRGGFSIFMQRTRREVREAIQEITLGAGFAFAMAMAARHAVMEGLGKWLGVERRLEGLSSRVGEWSDWVIPPAVANTEGAALPWALACAWGAAVTRAATLGRGTPRTLWLLAALAGLVACMGTGDAEIALAMACSVLLTCPLHARGWKPALTAATLGLMASGGIALTWGTPSPHGNRLDSTAWWVWSAGVLAVAIAGVVTLRRQGLRISLEEGNTSKGRRLAWISAGIAGLLYVGAAEETPLDAWRSRSEEALRAAEWGAPRRLRHELAAYRLDEAESAARRRPRPEPDTRWGDYEKLATKAPLPVAAWLHTDAAIYHPNPALRTQAEGRAREAWERVAEKNPESPTADAAVGWLSLHAAQGPHAEEYLAEAANRFRKSLRLAPESAQSWWGLGLAEASMGAPSLPRSERALAIACLLEPKFLFSPEWERPPLTPLRDSVVKRLTEWLNLAERTALRLPSRELAVLKRHLAWQSAWKEAKGSLLAFLQSPSTPPAADESVSQVRARLLETLRETTDDRIHAIFGAGVALLTDRHVNNGQSQQLFSQTDPAHKYHDRFRASRRLVFRPQLPGWRMISSHTEGGAGSIPYDFEENLLLRLTCYGREHARIHPDKAWLLEQISPSR